MITYTCIYLWLSMLISSPELTASDLMRSSGCSLRQLRRSPRTTAYRGESRRKAKTCENRE